MRLLSLTLALSTTMSLVAEEPPVILTLKPTTVEIEQRLNLDDNGRKRNDSSSLTIQFNAVTAPASANLTSFGRMVITEAVTDSGEKLALTQNDSGSQRIDPRMRRYRPGVAFNCSARLSVPRKPAKRITKLVGTIDLGLSAGKPKSAEIKPLKDFIGKRLQIEGVEGAEITISEHSAKLVEMTLPISTEQRLAELTFTDAAGVICNQQGGGSSTSNDLVERTIHVQVPGDGALVLQFHQDVRTVNVPFTVSDIPLPGAGDEGKPADAVIKATDVPDKAEPAVELKVKAAGEF